VQLPEAERAFVDPVKVRDYLLSPEHPVGRAKARFFGALGFTRAAWPTLHRVLLELAMRGEAIPGQPSPHGQKYEIRDTIVGPSEREAQIVTVWIILYDEDFPRLVTAYPGEIR
jgi:hypothetical protein